MGALKALLAAAPAAAKEAKNKASARVAWGHMGAASPHEERRIRKIRTCMGQPRGPPPPVGPAE